MANGSGNGTPDLQAIVEASRQRKKNEDLANKLLGSGRRQNAAKDKPKEKPIGGTLASRIGVNKRSLSATPKPGQLRHTEKINPRLSLNNRRPNSTSRLEKGERLAASLHREAVSNGNNLQVKERQAPVGQMSIRGLASSTNSHPIVMASNFAPGTTAADIQSAMTPIGGEIVRCRVLSASPTVLAEIEFVSRDGAENVVNTFNNQIADGRILYVYIKSGGPTPDLAPRKEEPAVKLPAPVPAPPADADVDMISEPKFTSRRDEGRLGSAQDGSRHDQGYQDGRFGFADSSKQTPREPRYLSDERDHGIHSDAMQWDGGKQEQRGREGRFSDRGPRSYGRSYVGRGRGREGEYWRGGR